MKTAFHRKSLAMAALAGAATLVAAGPAGAVVNFPPAGSNSFIALYDIGSAHLLCPSQCTIVSSTQRNLTLADSTFTDEFGDQLLAGGSITPTEIKGFVTTTKLAPYQLDLAFRDTYLVGGSGTDPFTVTARMHVEGSLEAVPLGSRFGTLGSIFGRIGTFVIDPAVVVVPKVATTGAYGTDNNSGGDGLRISPIDFSVPVSFDVTASRLVRPGDLFDLGYQVSAGASFGEADFRHTAKISFDLPDGVFLTAASGATFGQMPQPPTPTPGVPEPASWALMILGFGGAGAALRRRRPRPA